MERRLFRSTSSEHLQAELHQYELLREARQHRARSDRRTRRPAPAPGQWSLPRGLRLLVRRLAG